MGLFSAFLAPRTARLVGIELSNPPAGISPSNLDEFDHVELYQGSAGEILPHLDFQPDLVLADPPRSGLSGSVLDALLRMLPPNLAYISCDPATLARDLKRLTTGGYQLLEVIPFDLFPQTYHIESLALLARNSPG